MAPTNLAPRPNGHLRFSDILIKTESDMEEDSSDQEIPRVATPYPSESQPMLQKAKSSVSLSVPLDNET